jgi:outer membrane protein OmpA-like peptidoglycan-associated protein
MSSSRLSTASKLSLKKFAQEVKAFIAGGGKMSLLVVSGFAQPTLVYQDDLGLSLARANNVANYLRSLQIEIPLLEIGKGRVGANVPENRRVDVGM